MKVTSEKLQDSQVKLHIEVDQERSARSVDDAYRRLVSRVSIPGFRKGKAPRHIVERMVGHDALVQEGIDQLLPEIYQQALAETGIEPIDKPQVDIVQEQPLIVDMTVSVWPTIALGDYHDIRVERETVNVRDEEVEEVLQDMREQFAEWLPVERATAAGDRATIDVVGRVRGAPVLYNPEGSAILETESGEPVVDQKAVEYTVVLGSSAPVKGFAEELVGMNAGTDKRFELNFPADYPDKQLANKAVIFHVTVHSVKEKKLPEFSDEFAKTVGEYDTLEALRQTVQDNLQRRAEREAENRLAERALNMLSDKVTIEIPPSLLEREIDRLIVRTERSLRQANLSMDEFLRVSKKTKEELRADHRVDAIANLRHYFLLEEVAKAENIVVTPEEVAEEVARIGKVLTELGARDTTALNEPDRQEDIASDLRQRKARERLVSIAVGETAVEPTESDAVQSEGETSEAQ